MLEHLCIPRYDSVRSGWYRDNVLGAENQQERLVQLGWVVGFVDGEGCFSIGFVRQPNRASRKGYKTGYQVSHRFVVTQSVSSRSALEGLQSFFGVGRVYVMKRHDNHCEHLAQFIVNRREDLLRTIIPFFEAHSLHTIKQADFEGFACCVRMIDDGLHQEVAGLIEIAEVAETMNRKTPRHELIRILRGHTPEVQDTGS
jgi:LAGLIDADG endonuclease